MDSKYSWADSPVGGEDNRREHAFNASCEMLAPRPPPPDALLVLGCTERTNSIVCCTPRGRSGNRARVAMRTACSSGGTRPGWIKRFKTGKSANVLVLPSRASKSLKPEFLVSAGNVGSNACLPCCRILSTSGVSAVLFWLFCAILCERSPQPRVPTGVTYEGSSAESFRHATLTCLSYNCVDTILLRVGLP